MNSYFINNALGLLPNQCPNCHAYHTLSLTFIEKDDFDTNVEYFYVSCPVYKCSNCDETFPDIRVEIMQNEATEWLTMARMNIPFQETKH